MVPRDVAGLTGEVRVLAAEDLTQPAPCGK
jgi:hypothetical protein